MSRRLPLPLALVLVALAATGCSVRHKPSYERPGTPASAVPPAAKLSQSGTERFLAGVDGGSAFGDVSCGVGAEGWDYVCSFRDKRGSARGRLKIGVAVNTSEAMEASTPVPVSAPLPRHRGPGEPPPATPGFARIANGICEERRVKTLAMTQGATSANAVAVLGRIIDVERSEIAQLRELRAPAAERRAFDRLLSALDATLASERRFHRAVSRGDTSAARAASHAMKRHVARVDRLARSLGLPRCVES